MIYYSFVDERTSVNYSTTITNKLTANPCIVAAKIGFIARRRGGEGERVCNNMELNVVCIVKKIFII